MTQANTLNLQVVVPAPVAVPRGARWAASAGAAVWRFFERIGESRSRRALIETAERAEQYNPSLAAELRAAAAEIGRRD